MIVPKYWSESKKTVKSQGRQFTIKRFGWSDLSEAEAKLHSEGRLEDALKTLEETGDVRRVDHKMVYNGAEGVPIREEVISNHGDVVISRNSYGALCLNTPDVMFADIDIETKPSLQYHSFVFAMITAIPGLIALLTKSWVLLIVSFVVAVFLSSPITRLVHRKINDAKGGLEAQAMNRFVSVSERFVDLHMRVYKTTMGYRVLFMNETFDPNNDETIELLRSLGTDPVYMLMCQNQKCFRARVSPKPWRIGLDRVRPSPGIWPINPDRLKEREQWVKLYSDKSMAFASCRYIKSLGSDIVNEKAEFVRQLHDEFCHANETAREIA